jgi:hypothetical protein
MSHCLRSVATAVSGSGDEVTLIVCGLIATFILTRVGSCERDSGFPPSLAATNAPPVLVLSDRARLL